MTLRKIFVSGFALPRLRYAGTSVAITVALTISVPSSASAQARGLAADDADYTDGQKFLLAGPIRVIRVIRGSLRR